MIRPRGGGHGWPSAAPCATRADLSRRPDQTRAEILRYCSVPRTRVVASAPGHSQALSSLFSWSVVACMPRLSPLWRRVNEPEAHPARHTSARRTCTQGRRWTTRHILPARCVSRTHKWCQGTKRAPRHPTGAPPNPPQEPPATRAFRWGNRRVGQFILRRRSCHFLAPGAGHTKVLYPIAALGRACRRVGPRLYRARP